MFLISLPFYSVSILGLIKRVWHIALFVSSRFLLDGCLGKFFLDPAYVSFVLEFIDQFWVERAKSCPPSFSLPSTACLRGAFLALVFSLTLLFMFHSSILEPRLDLCLIQRQALRKLRAACRIQVSLFRESFLQNLELHFRENCSGLSTTFAAGRAQRGLHPEVHRESV